MLDEKHQIKPRATTDQVEQFKKIRKNFFDEFRKIGEDLQKLEDENNADLAEINRRILAKNGSIDFEDNLTEFNIFQPKKYNFK